MQKAVRRNSQGPGNVVGHLAARCCKAAGAGKKLKSLRWRLQHGHTLLYMLPQCSVCSQLVRKHKLTRMQQRLRFFAKLAVVLQIAGILPQHGAWLAR